MTLNRMTQPSPSGRTLVGAITSSPRTAAPAEPQLARFDRTRAGTHTEEELDPLPGEVVEDEFWAVVACGDARGLGQAVLRWSAAGIIGAMRIHALLLAGGAGDRFGRRFPSSSFAWPGETILSRSARLVAGAGIDDLVVVAHPDWLAATQEAVTALALALPTTVVAGGAYAQREHAQRPGRARRRPGRHRRRP